MQGRTHRPELKPDLCGICGICRGACPGRIFKDLSAEGDTARGRLARMGDRDPMGSPPCREACPLNQDIPGFVGRLAQGDQEGALKVILEDNPFPAVLGHVCHHPCEGACASAPIQRPPALRELKRFAAMAKRPEATIPRGNKRGSVAVVGAGPAGLASAWALARRAVRATVYEALPVPGGLPAWAIPPFRLPRRALEEDIKYILQHGIELKLDARLSPEAVSDLLSEYDAVVLACGAPRARRLDLPGNDLPNVWLGLDFLRRMALGPAPALRGPVVVVGGGNVAVDAARSALRMAAPVALLYRRDREQMPAYAEEVDAAEAEGLEFLFRTQPAALEGEPGKGVRRIRIRSTAPGALDEDGRPSFAPVDGDEKVLPAETVILALGQEDGFEGWAEGLGLERLGLRKSGRLRPRLYAAGDMITGPATVADAAAGGVLCAERILREVLS